MRKTLAGLLVVAGALSACTTDKASTAETTTVSSAVETTVSGTDTTLAADAIVDDRAPGVTADTIKVGVTYVDFSNLKAILGYDHGDYEKAYSLVVDAINEAGGVQGRTLELVFGPVQPNIPDSPAGACTHLVEDEEVFVAVGFFLDNDVLCYVADNERPVIGGFQSADLLKQAKSTWYTTEASGDAALAGIEQMAKDGVLSGTVAVVGTTSDQAGYEASIAPILEKYGVTPVDVAYQDMDANAGDTNAQFNAAEAIAERLSADGADQVLLIGNGISGTFPAALARTEYRPQLIFAAALSVGTFTSGEGNDLSVMDGAIAAGPFDGVNDYESLDGVTKECVNRATAAGLDVKPQKDVPKGGSYVIASVLAACRNIGVLVAILDAAGPTLNFGTFRTAALHIGSIDIAGAPDPYTFSPDTPDGAPLVYLWDWDPTTETMVRRSA